LTTSATTQQPQTTSTFGLQTSNLTHNFENQLKLSNTNIERQANNNNNFTSHLPISTAHPSSQFTILNDQLRATEFQATTGNGYQKLPPFRATQTTTSIDHNDVVDHHMLGPKFNTRLYTQSPQLPRKVYNNDLMSNQQQIYQPHHQIPMHHLGRESPYMQRKFPPQGDNNYSPYKPLPMQQNISLSPMMGRRYQQNNSQTTVSDEEYRILHGNTSPIVLQRFYHQQNQLRDQKREEQVREMRMNSASPFRNSPSHTSSIPIRPGGSPLNYRYQQQQHQHHPSMVAHRFQQQQEPIPNFHHASHIPQLQGRYVSNGNGTIKHQHQQQVVYDNLAHRPQIPCPGSPQLDRLRANMEKVNFYERHQKLPIESSYQLEMNRHNGDHNNDAKNKDKGKILIFHNSLFVPACFKNYFFSRSMFNTQNLIMKQQKQNNIILT
jgi:hypothetical protein